MDPMPPEYHSWIQCLLDTTVRFSRSSSMSPRYHSLVQDTTVKLNALGCHGWIQHLLDTTIGHQAQVQICLPDTTVGFNVS